jgi:proteasome activator subunit 4
MTEPHRFTSIMTCLTHIARQIVQQTPSYSQGQTYVLPLLMSVLPGIDLNDFEKTSVTLEFLETILMLITCIDCSSAVNTRNDLTEVKALTLISKKNN